MILTDTRKVLGIAALIAIVGVATTETMRQPAHAEANIIPGGAAGYAGERIDAAFQIVATMPKTAARAMQVAAKGDLPPLGCRGPIRPEIADECVDAAAEEPATVVETRLGDSTSVLSRVSSYQLAGF